jgi:hypothetical protein
MLATMRPIQHYQQTHIGDSRSTSRNSNYSNNGSPSLNRATPGKLSRTNSGDSSGSHHSKKATSGAAAKKPAAHSSLSNEVEAVKMTKPGLITLSKPLNGGGSKKASTSAEGAKAAKGPRKKKGPALLDDIKGSEDMLSRSAPAASKDTQGEWDMPAHRATGAAAEAPLNWQQEMIASTPEKKKTGKKAAGSKHPSVQSQATGAASKESLTWQQELLGSNKPRGPTFDVFADARDVATFGTDGEGPRKESKGKKQSGGRKRAESVGERAAHLPSKPVLVQNNNPVVKNRQESGIPTTPNGKFAYAGPNFHNSPSPASLPVPKFLQQRGSGDMTKSNSSQFAKEAMMRRAANGSGLSNDGDTSISSEEGAEEDQTKRSTRGATAPPEMQTEDRSSSRTIEDLLAKLMRSE